MKKVSRYQDKLILCGAFKSHSSSTAIFFQSSLPHTSYSGALIPQSCNEFKKAFNHPACLDLHWGQLSKSRQLTPNQLPHGSWVSRMGRPQRTPETRLNMKPRWPGCSALCCSLFPRPLRANSAESTLQRQAPNRFTRSRAC